MKTNKPVGERSFTLVETVIAVALMTAIITEAIGTMGNMVYFSNYSRTVTQAVYLAKRIMSQVEYQWAFKEFKELEVEEKEQRFKDEESESIFTYNVTVKEWEFPILDLLAGGGIAAPGEESESQPSEPDPVIKNMLSQVLGDHILKIAHVEVFWPEGAKRNSVDLTMLLTNQREVDNQILLRKNTAIQMYKKIENERKPPGTNNNNNNNNNNSNNNNRNTGNRNTPNNQNNSNNQGQGGSGGGGPGG